MISLVHYAAFQLPQKAETIQKDLGADNRPKAKKVHEVKEKMKNLHKTDCCLVNRSGWEKPSLGKALGEVWRDLHADPKWKYEQLAPVQLLRNSYALRFAEGAGKDNPLFKEELSLIGDSKT